MKQLSLTITRKRTPGIKLGRPITTHMGGRQKRTHFSSKNPLHLVLRLREGLPNLRTRKGAQIVKNAILGAQARGLRVVHFAILSNHIHLIVESSSPKAFYAAMKSFCSRIGIHVRRLSPPSLLKKLDQQGLGIFRGRYYLEEIRTPGQMKHALKYVLLNPAKHFKKAPYLDVFSSSSLFENWQKLIGYELKPTIQNKILRERLRQFLAPPKFWLTNVGWMRASSTA